MLVEKPMFVSELRRVLPEYNWYEIETNAAKLATGYERYFDFSTCLVWEGDYTEKEIINLLHDHYIIYYA